MEKNKIFIGLGILIVGFFLLGGTDLIDNLGGNKQKVTCEVVISNLIGFRPDIESVQCVTVDKCGLFSVSQSPFALTSEEVKVEFLSNGKITSKTGTVSELPGVDQTFQLELCVEKSIGSGKIKLYDEEGFVESKDIIF